MSPIYSLWVSIPDEVFGFGIRKSHFDGMIIYYGMNISHHRHLKRHFTHAMLQYSVIQLHNFYFTLLFSYIWQVVGRSPVRIYCILCVWFMYLMVARREYSQTKNSSEK